MKEYRTKQINFRVTESEYAHIKERMQEAGIKHPSAYFRKMAMDGYILKLDLGDLQEIQRLARINSNNINQIAKHANETGAVYKNDVEELTAGQRKIQKLLRDIFSELAKIH